MPSWPVYLGVAGLTVSGLAIAYEEIGAWRDRRRFAAPGRFVEVDGRRLHVRVAGRGSPAVVLEAGAGAWSSHWEPVFEALSATTTVVAYDRAGLGWSEVGRAPRSCHAITGDLEAVLSLLGLDGPYVLVGHSAGAMYARFFAHTRPDEVCGLVLVDPYHEDMPARWKADDVELPDPPRWLTFAQLALARFGVHRLLEQLRPLDSEPVPFNREQYAVLSHLWKRPAFIRATSMEDAAAARADEEMRQIRERLRVPTRVLTATAPIAPGHAPTEAFRDRYNRIWVEEHDRLLSWFEGARQTFVEDSDHMIPMRRPDLVVAAITELIAELATRPG